MTTSTSSSLTLRALLKGAVRRAGLSARAGRLSGLSPAAKALLVAAAEPPVVVVVPSDADVEPMTSDVRFFVAAMEGWAETELERGVLPFPSQEVDPYRGLAPHLEVASARARALHALATGGARVVVASAGGLIPRISAPERLRAASLQIAPGDEISPIRLGELLADAGFSREDPVDARGEFCVRGGVVDFFPAGEPAPIRLEFIGDTVESIRRYDAASQRSISALDQVAILPLRETLETGAGAPDRSATVFDYLRLGAAPAILVSEPDLILTNARRLAAQIESSHRDAEDRGETVAPPHAVMADLAVLERELGGGVLLEELAIDDRPAEPAAGQPSGVHVSCQPAVEFRGRIADWVADIRRLRERGETVVFVAATSGHAERAVELLAEYELVAVPVDRAEDTHSAAVLVATGRLSRGFRLPDAGLQIYAETDVFDEERRAHERRRSIASTFISDFRDLKVGDHVVHVDHGIGVFAGLTRIAVGPEPQEFMELRYAGSDKLFVPIERLDLVQKYAGGARPALDRLGGTTWERAKSRVRKAMRDMAGELLKLYAARKAVSGHAFAADSHWQQEFEDAFEYELTPDQRAAIADIKRDMESASPMDRLLCGDVGYGKTEVAMRAAFKAVMDGKQVALLAPTTVLAFQHLRTFRHRFAAFPVRIDMVSRFRSKAEQKQILADVAQGKVDIIIGTHRLLSKDVSFHDLGLLVVDEEQRFGVAHKERIKQMRRRVDVLTMTATPIPRTLNMSLVGIRDMSIIETPPKDRLAIQTNVVRFDRDVVAQAIRNELARSGQVYFVHNRVESISSVANLVARLVPEARLAVAHGQMSEDALERVMVDFVAHQYDILLTTTIIENGLDIPNANTLLVNRADRYGLSQLYQLRGRVGRSDRRAYAYLLIPPEEVLTPVARKRLAAIREFSDLGSGFRVAALDLEIRGAGNLLGGEQSGHIEAVGFDLYMKLLEQTVRELKGEELEDEVRAAVNIKIDLRIDDRYIPDMNQRLSVYRRIAASRTELELDRVLDEIRDRYGPLPPSVLNLAEYGRIRLLADRLGLESVDREGRLLMLKFRTDAPVDTRHLVRLVEAMPGLTLTPPAVLKLDLRQPALSPAAAPPGSRAGRPGREAVSGSWWTARATAAEVAPGFTKEAILRPVADDPRAPGGLFDRLGTLLRELSRGSGIG